MACAGLPCGGSNKKSLRKLLHKGREPKMFKSFLNFLTFDH